jgi:hypothetical protein
MPVVFPVLALAMFMSLRARAIVRAGEMTASAG